MGDKKPVIIIISSDEDEGGSWDDSDDEDCVILEEDPNPDKAVKVVNEKGSDDSDSDDLVVVSEKGQVACRDYPHPRHICAKFPFATTPHESHCDKCHCYVCDTLAPCLFWRIDDTLTHCNATDKMWIWRIQRENRKKSDEQLVPNQSIPETSSLSRNPHQQPSHDQQNCNPHHLQHNNTNSCSPTPHHIANHLNNLNLGPATQF